MLMDSLPGIGVQQSRLRMTSCRLHFRAQCRRQFPLPKNSDLMDMFTKKDVTPPSELIKFLFLVKGKSAVVIFSHSVLLCKTL